MKNRIWLLSLFITCSFATPLSHAYYMEHLTGDPVPVEQYNLGANLQYFSNAYKGFNLGVTAETGLTESTTAIVRLSFGKIDFSVSGDYKWVPIPDTDEQPAVGIAGGLILARVEGEQEFTLKAAPFVSKHFALDVGDFTPYASLPFHIRNYAGETDSPVQLVVGSDWKTLYWSNVLFNAEIGTEIANSFSYFAIGAIIEMDSKEGFTVKKTK